MRYNCTFMEVKVERFYMCNIYKAVIFAIKSSGWRHLTTHPVLRKVVKSNGINKDTEGAIESVPLNGMSAFDLYI